MMPEEVNKEVKEEVEWTLSLLQGRKFVDMLNSIMIALDAPTEVAPYTLHLAPYTLHPKP